MLRKLFIKTLGLFASIAILSSSFAGCTGKNEPQVTKNGENVSQAPAATSDVDSANNKGQEITWKASKPVTISYLYNGSIEGKNIPWLEEVKKRTNVTLELIAVPSSDFDKKRSILLSTNEAPDIISKTNQNKIADFVSSGVILPISDYLDKMPNFKKRIKEFDIQKEIDNKLLQLDGKFYVMPGISDFINIEYTPMIRKDILDKHNLSIPATYEQMYQILKSLKNYYPKSIPWSDIWGGDACLSYVASGFGTRSGWEKSQIYQYNEKDDNFIFGRTSENYRDFLTYMNMLVSEGLFDPETFTQDSTMSDNKILNGICFVQMGNAGMLATKNKQGKEINGENNYELIKLGVLASKYGALARPTSKLRDGAIIPSSSSKKSYFEDIIGFADWFFYSEEAYDLTAWGVEGVTYEIVDGKKRLLPHISFKGVNSDAKIKLDEDLCTNQGTINIINYVVGDNDVRNAMGVTTVRDLALEIIKQGAVLVMPDPEVPFSDKEKEEVAVLRTSLQDYTQQMTLKFILGEEPLSNWDKYVEECKKKGSEKLMTIVNEAYKRKKDKVH